MLARGIMGNPWLFQEVLGERDEPPTDAEILAELTWSMDRAIEHFGYDRAGRYMRKYYPWYVERLGAGPELQDAMQRAENLDAARDCLTAFAAAAA